MSTPVEIERDAKDIERVGRGNKALDRLRRTRAKLVEQRDEMNNNIATYDELIAKEIADLKGLKETLLTRYDADRVRPL